MRVGITIFNERISPLFDASRALLVLEVDAENVKNKETRELETNTPMDRADELLQAKIDILICGAISAPFAQAVLTRDIRLLAFHAGPINEIIEAFLNNQLNTRQFSMPGCGRRRRRRGSKKV